MSRLLIIDGNAMMHRAYHALPPLTSQTGEHVHVVYGFLSMIIRLWTDLRPTHMVVAFDRPGPTFRNTLYEKYQANRPQAEDDFISQIAKVHTAVETMRIPIFEADGFEADDVIGTLAKQSKGAGIDETIIISGDRDLLQLVSDPSVLCYMPTKGLSEGMLYGEKEVIGRMGVPPKKIPLYKALAGDPSDNYPGVPGIGEKTAVRLAGSYESLDEIYKAPIDGAVGKKLACGKNDALVSLHLATIRTDVPLSFDPLRATRSSIDSPDLQALLTTYGFFSLLKRLRRVGEKGSGGRNENETTKKDSSKSSVSGGQQQLL